MTQGKWGQHRSIEHRTWTMSPTRRSVMGRRSALRLAGDQTRTADAAGKHPAMHKQCRVSIGPGDRAMQDQAHGRFSRGPLLRVAWCGRSRAPRLGSSLNKDAQGHVRRVHTFIRACRALRTQGSLPAHNTAEFGHNQVLQLRPDTISRALKQIMTVRLHMTLRATPSCLPRGNQPSLNA